MITINQSVRLSWDTHTQRRKKKKIKSSSASSNNMQQMSFGSTSTFPYKNIGPGTTRIKIRHRVRFPIAAANNNVSTALLKHDLLPPDLTTEELSCSESGYTAWDLTLST